VPFRHPEPRDPLAVRIDAEVRQRLEEAVDYACLEALVAARRARGLPPPVTDNADDRREFERGVQAFLSRLERELAPSGPHPPRGPDESEGEAGRLLAVQLTLAKSLPNYWQRFDAVRTAWLTDGGLGGRPEPPMSSSGDARGLFARLFGRS
jgi:hypothetical protein